MISFTYNPIQMENERSQVKELNPFSIHKNSLIVKSNNLIEAKFKLNPNEQKFVYLLCSMIKSNDTEFGTYKLNVKDVASSLGIAHHNNIYASMYDIARRLRKKDLLLKTGEQSYLDIGWLSSTEIHTGKGYMVVSLDPKLKPYLLQLKEKFTKLHLGQVIQLKSFYSMRLYELCKQYLNFKTRCFSISELKDILCITEKSYEEYKNFKRRVLLQSIEEINLKTDLLIELKETRNGRKVTNVKFVIIEKTRKRSASPKTPKVNQYFSTKKYISNKENSDNQLNRLSSNDIKNLKHKIFNKYHFLKKQVPLQLHNDDSIPDQLKPFMRVAIAENHKTDSDTNNL